MRVDHSIVGIRARLESGAIIEHSLLMGADYYQPLEDLAQERLAGLPWIGIGENTHIRNAIIDKNVRIGSNVRILNEAGRTEYDSEDGSYFIREGIVIVPKGATITDGTII